LRYLCTPLYAMSMFWTVLSLRLIWYTPFSFVVWGPTLSMNFAMLVMRELLAANKIVVMALFATEIPSYYNELSAKTGGGKPSMQSKAACWALV